MKNCISLWSWFAIPWWLIKLNISFYAYWPCFSTVFCSFFYWLVWTWFQFISNCLPGPSHYSQATGQIKYPTLEGFPNTSCLEITLAFVHAVCSPSLLCSSPSPKGLQLSTNVTWSINLWFRNTNTLSFPGTFLLCDLKSFLSVLSLDDCPSLIIVIIMPADYWMLQVGQAPC